MLNHSIVHPNAETIELNHTILLSEPYQMHRAPMEP